MDPITSIYDRLRQRSASGHAPLTSAELPELEHWLQYWNDEDTELNNLRNFEHWLSQAMSAQGTRHSPI